MLGLYSDMKVDLQQSIIAAHGVVRWVIYGSQAVNWSDASEYHYHNTTLYQPEAIFLTPWFTDQLLLALSHY